MPLDSARSIQICGPVVLCKQRKLTINEIFALHDNCGDPQRLSEDWGDWKSPKITHTHTHKHLNAQYAIDIYRKIKRFR